MPVYEYRCELGHVTEYDRRPEHASDSAWCEKCPRIAKRVFSVPSLTFKGPGFYSTEYARPAASADD